MHAINRIKLDRHPDHFVLRLGLSASPDAGSPGEEVISVVLPLATALELAVTLFESVQLATPEMQNAFVTLLPRIAALNENNEKVKSAAATQGAT
jgi:hypothetical protein